MLGILPHQGKAYKYPVAPLWASGSLEDHSSIQFRAWGFKVKQLGSLLSATHQMGPTHNLSAPQQLWPTQHGD